MLQFTVLELKAILAAFVLLLLVSYIFIFKVLYRQRQLFRLPIAEEAKAFRRDLFLLSIVILGCSVIPLIYCASLIVADVPSDQLIKVPPLVFFFVFNSSVFSTASSYCIWRMYRRANRRR